ncbi:MAG: class IV adenylate cyclase [Candidatus Omnitrophota bacterium]
MRKEIEIKFLEIDVPAVLRRLRAIGARKVFDGPLRASYWDYSDRRFSRRGEVLRLRQKGKKVEMVFKSSLSRREAKVMDEFETLVEDYRTAEAIFRKLGMKVIRKVEKRRASFALGPDRFEIDRYPGIPPLLEIESHSMAGLRRMTAKLGLDLRQGLAWDSFQVLDHYRKKGRKK